ncbi:hypothetical protein ACFRMQ_33805 [Kitasatospora sp. NPDC056783]|uniref:hypothetical protein n=1 Tax=Kitasatospora sp. NPDC056783 TaxID=3345943 RepID=UPI003699029A
MRDVDLSDDQIAVLRQPRHHVRPDPVHVLPDDVPMRPLAILPGSDSSPEIAYETHHLEPLDEADTEAADALRELGAALDTAATSPSEREQVGGQFPKRAIEETNEDLADLVTTPREMGVVVHQPPASDHEQEPSAFIRLVT